jgi:hypothetical protein
LGAELSGTDHVGEEHGQQAALLPHARILPEFPLRCGCPVKWDS